MKKFILLLLMTLFSTCLVFSQEQEIQEQQKDVYSDFGTFKLSHEDNIISVSAYVTIEDIVDTIRHSKTKSNYIELDSLYLYDIYLVSKSVYNGDTTSTWLYGVRIFVNDKNILADQFPEGFTRSIKTTPTLIYSYRSKEPNNKFNVTWEKSVYEPRIRK